MSHRFYIGNRMFLVGAVLAAAVGVLASVPLVARTFFPRLTARLRGRFGRFVRAPQTRLRLERAEPAPGPEGGHVGFSLEEMTGLPGRVPTVGMTATTR